jgi:hypothetical protein
MHDNGVALHDIFGLDQGSARFYDCFFFSQSTSLRTVHDGQRHAVYCMALAYKLLRSVP